MQLTVQVTNGNRREYEEHTFVDLVKGREMEFPTLARATKSVIPATSPWVEWIVTGADGPVRWENNTQIFRYPYSFPPQGQGGDTINEDALTKFLASVEQTLEYGTPSYDRGSGARGPISTCGGFRHYLKRGLLPDDMLILRPLREPFLRVEDFDRYGDPLDNPTYEWLCEMSLAVIPAKES